MPNAPTKVASDWVPAMAFEMSNYTAPETSFRFERGGLTGSRQSEGMAIKGVLPGGEKLTPVSWLLGLGASLNKSLQDAYFLVGW